MLGTLGMVVPELLDSTDNVPWFDAGAKIFTSKGIQYLGQPGLINAKNIIATLIVQVTSLFLVSVDCCMCLHALGNAENDMCGGASIAMV